jgi:hypothetical protein
VLEQLERWKIPTVRHFVLDFSAFAVFYEMTNVKLFDMQSRQSDRWYFPYYDYLLVKKKKTFIGKIGNCKYFNHSKFSRFLFFLK